ncbi:hypothetical protein ACFFKU_17685 [Kineococcus gynurae]|uniref:Uncharacterized protein n=1 Tax=Kineococcus gynurae TaxID=452979 RepID=A0ABV5LNM6_9ACTN
MNGVNPGEAININNAPGGHISGNIGGHHNESVVNHFGASALSEDISSVVAKVREMPLDAAGREAVEALAEAGRTAAGGELTKTRHILKALPPWLSAMTASFSAGAINNFLAG